VGRSHLLEKPVLDLAHLLLLRIGGAERGQLLVHVPALLGEGVPSVSVSMPVAVREGAEGAGAHERGDPHRESQNDCFGPHHRISFPRLDRPSSRSKMRR
jgi:hypothetical protein